MNLDVIPLPPVLSHCFLEGDKLVGRGGELIGDGAYSRSLDALFVLFVLLSAERQGELGIGVIDALALVARGSIAQDGSRNVGILLFQQGNAVRVRFIACSLTAQVEADLVVARLEDLFNALGDDSVSQLGGNAALQGVGIPGEGGVDDQCLCDISRQMGNVDEVRRLSRYPRRGERCSALEITP